MFAYVARQAILDSDLNVHGYELFFRDGKRNSFPNIQPDEATSKIITNAHLTLGLEEITGGKIAYLNFYDDVLLNHFPASLDPKQVVIELVESAPINDELIASCQKLKNKGFQIALDDHDFDLKWEPLLPFTSLIKIDITSFSPDKFKQQASRYLRFGIRLVAQKVETYEQFSICKELGFDLFQGFFFEQPEIIRKRELPAAKLSLLQLVSESAKVEMNYDVINNIIEREVSLSYMLLRFINNPLFNKREKITSLRHALNYMGASEVKKFVALLALANLGEEKPPEVLNLSLVRAKFCELLAKARGDDENPPKGFLVGLFSMLDAMLDQKMENLVAKLPISEDLKVALCGQHNNLNYYLELAKTFEQANWGKTKKLAAMLKVDQRTLHGLYNQSIVWSNSMVACI
ncbi:EAL and HDOD domain-containing protein [Alteromonas sp. a30]|uniref:EAL and HDOD domain-containing protein n=1 Tax=Alteromonas sp. a30 TaxID=2730917 RepID=UPI00227F822E|nr:HDOD domain-containing protein [Alteromonas sp. a30]MCY7296788.1 EAL domain-containing protein [Alteromonas sp. a30]